MQMIEWSSSGNCSFSHINRWLRYHSKSPCQSECIPATSINIAAGQTWWLPAELGEVEVCLPRKLLRLIRNTQNNWKIKWTSLAFGRTSYSDLVAKQRFTAKKLAYGRCTALVLVLASPEQTSLGNQNAFQGDILGKKVGTFSDFQQFEPEDCIY